MGVYPFLLGSPFIPSHFLLTPQHLCGPTPSSVTKGRGYRAGVLVLPLWAPHSEPPHVAQDLRPRWSSPRDATELESLCPQHSSKRRFSVLINGIKFTSVQHIWNKRTRILQRPLCCQLKQLVTAKCTSCRYVHKRQVTRTCTYGPWEHSALTRGLWVLPGFSSFPRAPTPRATELHARWPTPTPQYWLQPQFMAMRTVILRLHQNALGIAIGLASYT